MNGIHIGAVDKNMKDRIKVCLDTFKGYRYIRVVTWIKTDKGEYVPTNKGLTLNLDCAIPFTDLILKANKTLRELRSRDTEACERVSMQTETKAKKKRRRPRKRVASAKKLAHSHNRKKLVQPTGEESIKGKPLKQSTINKNYTLSHGF
jgi:hypothetical protein